MSDQRVGDGAEETPAMMDGPSGGWSRTAAAEKIRHRRRRRRRPPQRGQASATRGERRTDVYDIRRREAVMAGGRLWRRKEMVKTVATRGWRRREGRECPSQRAGTDRKRWQTVGIRQASGWISVSWQLAINMAMISRWSVIYYVSRGATVQPNSSRRQFSDEFVGYVSRVCRVGSLTGEGGQQRMIKNGTN